MASACSASPCLVLIHAVADSYSTEREEAAAAAQLAISSRQVNTGVNVSKEGKLNKVVCRQLGPVLHSPGAESHGLGTSLLEAFVRYHESQAQQYARQGLASCLGMA